jgi:hypothetical protein
LRVVQNLDRLGALVDLDGHVIQHHLNGTGVGGRLIDRQFDTGHGLIACQLDAVRLVAHGSIVDRGGEQVIVARGQSFESEGAGGVG